MSRSRAWVWPASIAITAFALRLLSLNLLFRPDRVWNHHRELAQALRANGWLPGASWGESPVTLYWLALLDPVPLFAQLVLQLGLSSISCLLIWVVASRLFGPFAGRVAGFLWALFGGAILHDLQPGPGPLVVLLGAAALLAAIRAERPRGFFVCGLLLGLAACIQLELWLVGLAAIWIQRRTRPACSGLAIGLLAVALTVVGLQGLGTGIWTPGFGGHGYRLYAGLSFDAELYERPEPAAISELSEQPRNRTARAIALARHLTDDPRLEAGGAERFWFGWLGRSLRDARSWRLMGGRALLALHQLAGEQSSVLLYQRYRLRHWPLASFGLLVMFAVVGWFVEGRRGIWLGALALLLATRLVLGGVMHGDRLLLGAVLCLMAGAGAAGLAGAALRRRLGLAGLATLVGLLVVWPWPPVRLGRIAERQLQLQSVAQEELLRGTPAAARTAVDEALALDPYGPQWQVLRQVAGTVARAQHRGRSADRLLALAANRIDEEAVAEIRQVVARAPGWEHRRILGRFLMRRRLYRDALPVWQALGRERPDHPEPAYQAGRALVLLNTEPQRAAALLADARQRGMALTPLGADLDYYDALLLVRQRRFEQSRVLLQRSIARNPLWVVSWRALARLLTELSDAKGAVNAWESVLRLRPRDREARRALGR